MIMDMVTLMLKSENHNIKMVDINGKEFYGYVKSFTSDYDNEEDDEPGRNSFSLDVVHNDGDVSHYEIYENEIASIEILD